MSFFKKNLFIITFLFFSFSYSELLNNNDQSTNVTTNPTNNDTSLILPVIFSSPETGVGYGAQVMFFKNYWPELRTQNSAVSQIVVIGTEEKQSIYILGHSHYSKYNQQWLNFGLSYIDMPSYFYGIGAAAPRANQEKYSPHNLSFSASYAEKFKEDIYFGPKINIKRIDIVEVSTNGILDLEEPLGSKGAIVSGLGFKFLKDSRDAQFYPENGNSFYWESLFYKRSFGSDHEYASHLGEIKNFHKLQEKKVLASQLILKNTTGAVPFSEMGKLGGEEIMRGYYRGRFTDKTYLAFQEEYRFGLKNNWGGVTFIALGQVADKFQHLKGDLFNTAFGAGLRYQINEKRKINIRLDLAFHNAPQGLSGPAFYINFLEAF